MKPVQLPTLGPLLLNIFINNIFLFVEKSEVCNFGDGNTSYSYGKDLLRIEQDLIYDMEILFKWFTINSLKSNPEKFQTMIVGEKTCCKHPLVKNSKFDDANEDVSLLGITIEKKLTFNKHINNLNCNAKYKLHALRRIRKFLKIEKVKSISN